MEFDREKCEDEYIKMQDILLENPPEPMKNLYVYATGYRDDASGIYHDLTNTIQAEFPGRIRTVLKYSDPEELRELEEYICNAESPEKKAEYTAIRKEFLDRFQKEADAFNERIHSLNQSMQERRDILEKNLRNDLTSGAFFYGKTQEAMRIRGKQIEQLAVIIQDVYVAEMNKLKEEIKVYNEKIDKFLDPSNSFQRFMKAIPSADEFESLTKFAEKNPDTQVEAMKAAYSVAIKGITFIGDEIVNVKNMEEREKIQKELNQVKQDYEKYNNQYEKVIHEYNMVKNLVKIMDGMRYFSDQAGKFTNDLSDKLEKLDSALNNQDVELYHSTILEVKAFLTE